jgi:hypothetical protein
MRSFLFVCATLFTLLAGDGLAGSVSTAAATPAAVGIAPVVDVPSPNHLGAADEASGGGQAARIELDDAQPHDGMSAWYWLAYIHGGNRLQVFEHYPATTSNPESDISTSENVAWRLANEAVEPDRSRASDHLPRRARIRTGSTSGPSAGLMFTLAYIDLLTPGALVGNLRVAGTGGIGADGVATPVAGVDVKIAAALLTRPDVIFTSTPPKLSEPVTIVESHHTRTPDVGYTVAEWLNLLGYQQAGRAAANHPGTVAVVVVHDLRQALAWLCGRTNSANACTIARRSGTIPIGTP